MHSWQDDNSTIVVLEKGEKLVESLTQFAQLTQINAASLQGLGALEEVELGYYDLHKKTYKRTTLKGDWELVAMNGNITLKDGMPFVHVHAALGGEDFSLKGGHLFEAVVAVTCEVSLIPHTALIERHAHSAIGLSLCSPHAFDN